MSASSTALDALANFGKGGPKMPDFSGAQFGGLNNLNQGSTNPFAMSPGAGAAASRLPQMGGGAGGAGVSNIGGSINKLIASNNKLIAAINKLAAAMSGGRGGAGAGGMGMGAGGLINNGEGGTFGMGVFEQLNLQKQHGIRGGGGGSRPGGANPPTFGAGKPPENDPGVGAIDAAFERLPKEVFGLPFRTPAKFTFLAASGLTGNYLKTKFGINQLGMGQDLGSLAAQIPMGMGLKTAQNISVINNRASEMGGLERRAFQTAAAVGRGLEFRRGGGQSTADMFQAGNLHQFAKAFGLTPDQAMEQIQDVYTTGGFAPGSIGGIGRDQKERSLTVDEIFRFKTAGFGSTVMGNIQEMMFRGSGARGLIGGGPAGVAEFGVGMGFNAKGMNKLTAAMSSFGQQANMFGMDDSNARRRLFREAVGFEKDTDYQSFQGMQNAVNQSFMTHQTLAQGATGQISGLFGGISQRMGMAMALRQAQQELGPGAGGVAIARRANDLARTQTPQQKVAFLRSQGFSEDVIEARLLGENLTEAQIGFAMDDTAGRGRRTINDLRKRGAAKTQNDLAQQAAAMPISSETAANQGSNVIETYTDAKNLDKIKNVIAGQAALERQLFRNAEYSAANTEALLGLSKIFTDTGSDLTAILKKTNKMIDAVNKVLPASAQISNIGTQPGPKRKGGL